jgi:heme exporter protein C
MADSMPTTRFDLNRLQRPLGWLTAILVVVTLWAAFFGSPAEVMLGETIRIFYIHVGAAWTAYLAYGVTALASLAFLSRRQPALDRLAMASAEVGTVLTSVTLISGMFWGRAAQGWWWRWDDTRLVLTLFMWLLYIAYLILRQYSEGERRARISAVLALVGIPVMILNHFAVVFWQKFHPSIITGRPDPAVDSPLLGPLFLSLGAYTLLYLWLLLRRYKLESEREAWAETLAEIG